MLPHSPTPGFASLAIALILIGIGFKVSAAPFQVWTPDVYEGAPSPVVALMSTGPKVAAFAVLLRILYGAYPALHAHWQLLLWIMAALSMTVGNLGALRQQNVKRMLAYSSIAHAGYTLVAFTAFSSEGMAAVLFYTASYAAMNVGAFAIISHVGGYEDRLGLGRRFSWRRVSFAFAGRRVRRSVALVNRIPFTAASSPSSTCSRPRCTPAKSGWQ